MIRSRIKNQGVKSFVNSISFLIAFKCNENLIKWDRNHSLGKKPKV